jgi:hypothetical protein
MIFVAESIKFPGQYWCPVRTESDVYTAAKPSGTRKAFGKTVFIKLEKLTVLCGRRAPTHQVGCHVGTEAEDQLFRPPMAKNLIHFPGKPFGHTNMHDHKLGTGYEVKYGLLPYVIK